MNFVYQNKYLKESVGQGTLQYKPDSSISEDEGGEMILDGLREDDGRRNKQSTEKKSQIQQNGIMVSCIIEQEEMFIAMNELVGNDRNYSDLFEKMTELINSYTQSLYIRNDCLIDYVLPIQTKILSTQNISMACFNFILESLVRLLKQQEMCIFILQNYDISLILNQIIANEQYAFNENVFSNLELVVKLIFYNPVKISKTCEQFIKALLGHQSSIEYNRLGLFSLYCVSLALQEQQYSSNLALFNEDSLIRCIFNFIVHGNVSPTHLMSMIKKGSPDRQNMNSMTALQTQPNSQFSSQRLKYLALQILVNVLEYINQEVTVGNQKLQKASQVSQQNLKSSSGLSQGKKSQTSELLLQFEQLSQIYKQITERFFLDSGFLSILMKICSNSSPTEMVEEKRLAARAFASLPVSLITHICPLVDLKMKESQETFTLLNYFQAINSIVRLGEPESIYFVLYALLNLITNLDLPAPPEQTQQQIMKQDSMSKRDQMIRMNLSSLDYPALCATLIKSGLLQQILILPQRIGDEDVIRVCLKLLITIMFKGQSHRILFLEGPMNQPGPATLSINRQHASSSQQMQNSFFDYGAHTSIWDQLGIPIENEREKSREQLKGLIQKVQTFELSQIHQGGYVQFLHLISQVLLTTTNNNQHLQGSSVGQNSEERNKLLPPSNVMAEIVKKICEQMNEKEIFKTISGEDLRNKKLLLYKFFFLNYMLSVTIPDILWASFSEQQIALEKKQESAENGEKEEEEKVEKEKVEIELPQVNAENQIAELPEKLFKTLVLMLDNMKDRNINKNLDYLMIQFKQQGSANQQNKGGNERFNKQSSKLNQTSQQNYEESKDGILPQNNNNQSQNHQLSSNQPPQPIDDSQSTTLSILRLILFNIDTLLKQTLLFLGINQASEEVNESNKAPAIVELTGPIPSYLILTEQLFETILSFLTEYEDNGDIVESCYTILDHFLRVSLLSQQSLKPSPTASASITIILYQNMMILEKSKTLLSIGIKHSAAYQCEQAYLFLKLLVTTSEKYKNKGEIEQALNSIIPNSLKVSNNASTMNRSIHLQSNNANQNNNQAQSVQNFNQQNNVGGTSLSANYNNNR